MRERWAIASVPGPGWAVFTSQAAMRGWVCEQVGLWSHGEPRHGRVNVYLDEHDGHGWQLRERLDLARLTYDREIHPASPGRGHRTDLTKGES